MGKTSIAWTDFSFNPWRGCVKVSPGCQHCYAETLSKRWGLDIWGVDKPRIVASESYWKEPVKWNRQAKAEGIRKRVFCASLADVFEDRPDLVAPRARLFGLIHNTPHLDWLLLTKRLENVPAMVEEIAFVGPDHDGSELAAWWRGGIPPQNIWLGTTVENQEMADKRIPILAAIPAQVRFLSCEPLLGPVDLKFGQSEGLPTDSEPFRERQDLIHWVIIGGESGAGARVMYPKYASQIINDCKTADVACFMKQTGTVLAGEMGLDDKKGGNPDEWPEWMRVQQFPTPRR